MRPWAQLSIYCYSGWLVGFVQYLFVMCFTVQIYFLNLYSVSFLLDAPKSNSCDIELSDILRHKTIWYSLTTNVFL